MARARTYAKLVTPNGEYKMTHAELDQLNMLLSVSLKTDTLPKADPPILRSRYEELRDWIQSDFKKNHKNRETPYLD